jgi:hypothetical protein
MTKCHDYGLWRTVALMLSVSVIAPMVGLAQQIDLPKVVSASVPFYPRIPQHGHIEGTVRLRVFTDGARVAHLDVESGPPMLAQAAQENVKTWRFELHNRTSFPVTFRYQLLKTTCSDNCKKCESAESPSILLKLPREVEVNAEEVLVCDPRVKNNQQN